MTFDIRTAWTVCFWIRKGTASAMSRMLRLRIRWQTVDVRSDTYTCSYWYQEARVGPKLDSGTARFMKLAFLWEVVDVALPSYLPPSTSADESDSASASFFLRSSCTSSISSAASEPDIFHPSRSILSPKTANKKELRSTFKRALEDCLLRHLCPDTISY